MMANLPSRGNPRYRLTAVRPGGDFANAITLSGAPGKTLHGPPSA